METEAKPGFDPNVGREKISRKPKQGNSELFNEILSAANALSVTERVRLTKSLGGQLGYTVVAMQGQVSLPKGEKGGKNHVTNREMKPNPLRGTKFQVEKDLAFNAMVEAKRGNNGKELPTDHPAVLRYKTALNLYKQAQSELKPVEASAPLEQSQQPRQSSKKRVKATSPEPGGSIASRLRKQVKNAVTRSFSKEEDEKHL